MGALLGLLSAVAYVTGDFAAGLAGRRYTSGPVTAVGQGIGLLAAALAVVVFAARSPTSSAVEWGALSGVGSAVGTLALYEGLAVGQMSVVASLSAVITAVLPVLAGIMLGDRLAVGTACGIVIAVAAIALVSWQPAAGDDERNPRTGVKLGLCAGVGFALLLIALDRAGTRSGAWPLVPGQAVSLALLLPVAVRGTRRTGRPDRSTLLLMLAAGCLSATGNILFLAATGHGALAVVAVLTALYPAVTVLLARFLLAERWSRRQAAGLITSAVAVALVSLH